MEISDYQYMMSLLKNFNDISRIVTQFSYQNRLQAAEGRERATIKQEMDRTIAAAKLDDNYVKNLMRLFETFVKDRLIIKAMPFSGDTDIRIVGPLQPALLRDLLEDIRFKFGSSPVADWTVFGQIAAVPQQHGSRTASNFTFSNDIDRVLQQLFESIRGIEDSFRVTYPEIAISPIAIYRD